MPLCRRVWHKQSGARVGLRERYSRNCGASMEYLVEITPRAQSDLDEIYDHVVRAAPYRGPLWFDRFERAIQSLAGLPERYPVLPKLSTPNRTVRQLLFGRR